jgi:hypothetical protein
MNRALDAIQRKPSSGKAASGSHIPQTSAEIMAPSQAVHKFGGFKEFMLSDLQRCRLEPPNELAKVSKLRGAWRLR